MSKKPKIIITHTLLTDGKIILSKEELVSLIRLRYPEFPIGECTISVKYASPEGFNDPIKEIIVRSTKSENYES